MDKLRKLRTQKGLSQQALARSAGVAQSTVSEIEAGKSSPKVKVLIKLATALEVPVSELLEEDSNSVVKVQSLSSKNTAS